MAARTKGDDCLVAQEVKHRAYDNHPIYDLDSRQQISFCRGMKSGPILGSVMRFQLLVDLELVTVRSSQKCQC